MVAPAGPGRIFPACIEKGQETGRLFYALYGTVHLSVNGYL